MDFPFAAFVRNMMKNGSGILFVHVHVHGGRRSRVGSSFGGAFMPFIGVAYARIEQFLIFPFKETTQPASLVVYRMRSNGAHTLHSEKSKHYTLYLHRAESMIRK